MGLNVKSLETYKNAKKHLSKQNLLMKKRETRILNSLYPCADKRFLVIYVMVTSHWWWEIWWRKLFLVKGVVVTIERLQLPWGLEWDLPAMS